MYLFLEGRGISNAKISLDFGFLDEKSLSRHFGEKNKVFSPFEYMEGLRRPKSCLVVVDLPYSAAVL